MSLAPDRGQDVLAAGQLGGQRGQRPLDQVRVQVGDHADRVRQPDAVLERAAALVVDEHERHRVRAVGHGQRRRRSSAAARTCPSRWCRRSARAARPGAGRCRTGRRRHAPITRRWTGRRSASGRRSPSAAGGSRPSTSSRRLDSGSPALLLVGADVPDRGDAAASRVAPAGPDESGRTPVTAGWFICLTASAAGPGRGHRVALGGQQPLLGVQADRVHPDLRSLPQDLHHAGQQPEPPGPVQHDHDARPNSTPPGRRGSRGSSAGSR